MIYHELGRTGINVSKLCFGSLTMGPFQRNLTPAQGAVLFECAFSHGVNFVDTADIPNVAVMHSNKLLADFAREQGSSIIIKGLRAVSDFEREFQMALMNHKLNPGLDTMFLTAEHQFMYLSSSAVKELARYDADVSDFLPAAIIPDFKARIMEQI